MDQTSGIVLAARSQIGQTISYDPSYVAITYPNGDVPLETGVCSDVIIRALRLALKMDLQELIHQDMQQRFHAYPQRWGLSQADAHIDHRRVPNIQCYLSAQGFALPIFKDINQFLPGDIVTCVVGQNLAHIMIVSDRKDEQGVPYIIHNIGAGCREEARLFEFELTGHYRIDSKKQR
ncbi:MAG: DUF1287 domain-containing protein [Planctomycetes bacterium]|nr:DUF1287 domain-containing protein [Planctomycetota bacterium]